MNHEAVQPMTTKSKTFVQKILFAALATLFLVLIFSYYPFLKNSTVSAAIIPDKKDTSEAEVAPKQGWPLALDARVAGGLPSPSLRFL